MTNANLIEVRIPAEFIDVCREWHDGMGCPLYAVASTGELTTGTDRPWDVDKDRPATDAEWHVAIWLELAEKASETVGDARRGGNKKDAAALRRMAGFSERVGKRLAKRYGLAD